VNNLRRFFAAAAVLWPLSPAWAWDDQRVLEFILVNNPLLRAYRVVTTEYTPPGGVMDRVKEHTAFYGRAGAGGTDYIDKPITLQAGVQILIPLTSTKERREHAVKAVEETRAMEEVRAKVLADIARLRQHEADLQAAETRLKFYQDKSGWLQKRVKEGFEEVDELWNIGQKLHEDRAATERLRALLSAQQYQLANYAGEGWQTLLGYLKGKGELM
jgi:hypothetical protein